MVICDELLNGDNFNGSLGAGSVDDHLIFTLIPTPAPVMFAIAGFFHSSIVTTTGQLYACGRNWNGGVGIRRLRR